MKDQKKSHENQVLSKDCLASQNVYMLKDGRETVKEIQGNYLVSEHAESFHSHIFFKFLTKDENISASISSMNTQGSVNLA